MKVYDVGQMVACIWEQS